MNTIESFISICIDNFNNREEKDKDVKSMEKLFINALRTI